jgi:hypothetical protein
MTYPAPSIRTFLDAMLDFGLMDVLELFLSCQHNVVKSILSLDELQKIVGAAR